MGKGFGSASRPVRLSLCAIAKNEAHRLGNCLASVRGFADEIVVVDTGSSDRTVEIAKQHKAKVFRFAWCDDFAAARNYALCHAKGEWILVLDADELLDAAIQPILTEVMQQQTCLAVNLVRLEVGASQSPYSLVSRLFRRRSDLGFTGIYHERIDRSVEQIIDREPHWQVVTIPAIAIHHYGYQTHEIAQKQKYDFAKRLMHKHLEAFPQDSYMYSKLGALYVSESSSIGESERESLSEPIGQDSEPRNLKLERGIELLQTGLDLASQHSQQDQTLFELYYHLGIAYTQRSQSESAKQAYQTALELNVPDLVKLPAYNNLGSIWLEETAYDLAIAAYAQAIAIAPDFAKGFCNLGIALKAAGRLGEALSAYERAIAIAPEYAEAHQNLGVVLLRLGQVPLAIANFKQAIFYHEQQQNFANAEALRSGLQDMGLF
ncbi:glycosyltransferase [Tumidithrix helvetica PCC 7403]|uniref:glycosyltransferase family 2 protein n=1 Tax=Tumidithrix helvetica TaxID=3457545 RepID=UPI003C8155B6